MYIFDSQPFAHSELVRKAMFVCILCHFLVCFRMLSYANCVLLSTSSTNYDTAGFLKRRSELEWFGVDAIVQIERVKLCSGLTSCMQLKNRLSARPSYSF